MFKEETKNLNEDMFPNNVSNSKIPFEDHKKFSQGINKIDQDMNEIYCNISNLNNKM
jgi:hypothetical protein